MTALVLRRWPCEEECDDAACSERVAYALRTPVDTMYLCEQHGPEWLDKITAAREEASRVRAL